MIEVFKTNVQEELHANNILKLLLQQFPHHKINFDLEDCDKILRIEGANLLTETVVMTVEQTGFNCRLLE